jgi:hypothetical protein
MMFIGAVRNSLQVSQEPGNWKKSKSTAVISCKMSVKEVSSEDISDSEGRETEVNRTG